jgi:hypothetical protein
MLRQIASSNFVGKGLVYYQLLKDNVIFRKMTRGEYGTFIPHVGNKTPIVGYFTQVCDPHLPPIAHEKFVGEDDVIQRVYLN